MCSGERFPNESSTWKKSNGRKLITRSRHNLPSSFLLSPSIIDQLPNLTSAIYHLVEQSRLLPLVMPLPRMWLLSTLINRLIQLLTIIMMLPEVIQLRLIELGWQLKIARILQPLQRRAHTRYDRVILRPLDNQSLQWLKAGFELRHYRRLEE